MINNPNLKLALIAWAIVAIAIAAVPGAANNAHSINPAHRLGEAQRTTASFDQGQAASISDTISGGTPPYAYQWLLETPGSASYSLAPQSVCPVSSSNDVYLPENSQSLTVACTFQTGPGTQTGMYSFTFNLTDNSSTPEHYANTTNVVINPAPSIALYSASATTAVGANDIITASVSGGVGPYIVNILYQNGTVAYSSGVPHNGIASYGFVPSEPGNYVFWANALDTGTSHQFAFGSAPVSVSAAGPLTDANVLVTEQSNAIDVPQNVVLTASVDSGIAPYAYAWSLNGNQVGYNSPTLTVYGNSSTLGSDSISVEVTDASGRKAAGSNTITVNSELNDSEVAVIVPQNTLYVGGNEIVSALVTGGTPPYTYSGWTINYGEQLQGASNAITLRGNYTDLGRYNYISVNVTDSSGESATGSNTFNVSIRPDVYLTATPNAVDEGQNTILTEHINGTSFQLGEDLALGGTASANAQKLSPYTVSFYDSATNTLIATVPANALFSSFGVNFTASTVYSPGQAGIIPVNAVVAYSYNGTVYTVSYNSITVYGRLSVSATPASASAGQGGSATYSASVSGGSGNFVYQWYNYSGSSPSPIPGQKSRNLTVQGAAPGTFTYFVQATDVGVVPGMTAYSGNVALYVSPPTTTALVLGSGGTGASGGGSQKPTVKHEKSCYGILNFTQDNQETLVLNGTPFNIVENFITPTSAGISVNGRAYSINDSGSVDVGSAPGYNYTLQLQGISYLPIGQTISVSLCSSQAAKVPNKNKPANASSQAGGAPVTLNISSNGTITAVGQPGHTVQIIADGNVVAQGSGLAVYDGYGLMPGIYKVVGRDNVSMAESATETFLRPKDLAVIELTGSCVNSTSSTSQCTVTGTIYSNGSVLNASLYLNGNYLGTTLSEISDTRSAPGNYMYVFSTPGSAQYAPDTISYNYTIGGPQPAPAMRSVVAVVAAISSSVTAAALLRYGHR